MPAFAATLGLDNVTVLAERRDHRPRSEHRERYGLVTARLRPAPRPCRVRAPSAPAIRSAARVEGADLGRRASGRPRRRGMGGGTVEERPTGIAALGDHRFVVVPKLSTTPDRFPRRPGEPARRPLG